MELDLEELAAIVELLEGADFTEFRLQKGDLNLVVTRGEVTTSHPAPASPQPVAREAQAAVQESPRPTTRADQSAQPATSSPTEVAEDEVLITTPMLGTFYRSPKPGEPVFVEVGDKVEPDSVVAIVEVMKLMNSVAAGVTGEVTKVFSRDGDLVEADQALFAVRTF